MEVRWLNWGRCA